MLRAICLPRKASQFLQFQPKPFIATFQPTRTWFRTPEKSERKLVRKDEKLSRKGKNPKFSMANQEVEEDEESKTEREQDEEEEGQTNKFKEEDDEEEGEEDEDEQDPELEAESIEELQPHYIDVNSQLEELNTVVKVGRHTKITTGGRVYGFSALVVTGTGRGTAGIGYGKANDADKAIENAYIDAKKNLVSVYRHENRTIPYDMNVKYGSTKLIMRTHKEGAGLRGHPTLTYFAECFGYKDLLIKIHGSTNPHHMLRALQKGFSAVQSPDEDAKKRGKKRVDFTKIFHPEQGQTPFNLDPQVRKELAELGFFKEYKTMEKDITPYLEIEEDEKEAQQRAAQ